MKAHNSAQHNDMRFCYMVWGTLNSLWWYILGSEASFVSVIELAFCNKNLQILYSFFTFLFFLLFVFFMFVMTSFGRLNRLQGLIKSSVIRNSDAEAQYTFRPVSLCKFYLNSSSHFFLIFSIHNHLKGKQVLLMYSREMPHKLGSVGNGIHIVLSNMLCIVFP